MTARVLALAMVAACSSAPPERSARADARGGTVRPEAASEPAPPEADRASDVSAAELDRARHALGCEGEGGGLACEVLQRFTGASTPRWREGSLAGVLVRTQPGGGVQLVPALLAVRGRGAAVELAWGVVTPADPHEATRLAAQAADVLGRRDPREPADPLPGFVWHRPVATEGTSARLDRASPRWARQAGAETIVLGLDETGPWLAIHRAAAAGTR